MVGDVRRAGFRNIFLSDQRSLIFEFWEVMWQKDWLFEAVVRTKEFLFSDMDNHSFCRTLFVTVDTRNVGSFWFIVKVENIRFAFKFS